MPGQLCVLCISFFALFLSSGRDKADKGGKKTEERGLMFELCVQPQPVASATAVHTGAICYVVL